jgi:hypothetical protein
MNRFRTLRFSAIKAVFWGFLLLHFAGFNSGLKAQEIESVEFASGETAQPIIEKGSSLFADIDTTSQKVYLFLHEQLWSYDLQKSSWNLEAKFDSLPAAQTQFEFGLNPDNKKLYFWSQGVGKVYEVDKEEQKIYRIDRSFDHKNQFGHIPFFREGTINAFGGYGLWLYKNYITYFSPEIMEWSIISVDPKTTPPSPRNAFTGFYEPVEDAFYAFGGIYSENNRPDDKNINRDRTEDLWKFRFKSQQWEYITDLSFGEWDYEYPGNNFGVIRVNSLATSVFSPISNNYYIPYSREDAPNVLFYLAAFNTKTNQIFEPVEIPLENERTFIVTNYLFNPKSKEFVLVGKSHLTNQKNYPVQIITIPEDTLLALMEEQESGVAWLALWLSFGGILIIAFILILRSNISDNPAESAEEVNNSNDLTEIMNGLSEHEKNLLKVLYEYKECMESHELEEQTWPQVTNYDYRRKMRNETINSLNEKFQDEIEGSEAVFRKKDPNDNRRFLYGLNEIIKEAWKQVHKS